MTRVGTPQGLPQSLMGSTRFVVDLLICVSCVVCEKEGVKTVQIPFSRMCVLGGELLNLLVDSYVTFRAHGALRGPSMGFKFSPVQVWKDSHQDACLMCPHVLDWKGYAQVSVADIDSDVLFLNVLCVGVCGWDGGERSYQEEGK